MKPIKYLKGVQRELKKVSWPTQKQSINITALVILLSVGIAYYLGAFDYLFSSFFEAFIF